MPDFSHLCSAIFNPRETERLLSQSKEPYFGASAKSIAGSGRGKTALNHKIVEKVLGSFPIIVQETSDCVSFGFAGALNSYKCTQVAAGELTTFGGFTATEPIYAGSRVQIGQGQLGNGGGSMGIWAVEFGQKYGTIIRGKYGNIDLTNYSAARADQWGNPRSGVPKELLPLLAEHKLTSYSKVSTWAELCDALYNGYMVTVASNRGFGSSRDKDGFLTGRANWPHQMYFCSYTDEGNRPGALLVNSWPTSWVSGPKGPYEVPDGTGFVDAQTIERDMLSEGDSFSISGFQGYPPRDLSWGDLFR